MKKPEKIKNILRVKKSLLESAYGVKSIGLFGSFVREEQKKNSGVDILVEFKVVPDFFGFLELEEYLHGVLKVKVDLVSKRALKPHIGKRILDQVEYV